MAVYALITIDSMDEYPMDILEGIFTNFELAKNFILKKYFSESRYYKALLDSRKITQKQYEDLKQFINDKVIDFSFDFDDFEDSDDFKEFYELVDDTYKFYFKKYEIDKEI